MRVESDFLILGSGVAGLSLALKLSKLGKVNLITKAALQEGATKYAQGGIASVFSQKDSFASHIHDTLEAGAGLCQPHIVELTVQEGPDRVRELIDLGVPFSKKENSEDPETFPYDLTKEGGHRQRRILHATDFTGLAIEDTLIKAVHATASIKVYENFIGIDLIVTKKSSVKIRCLGAYVLDASLPKKHNIHTFSAAMTILATGGAGKVYLYTSNPDTATGDGIAMAYRAGSRIANMEFMQFHPTCLYVQGTPALLDPGAKSFLISESLRGEGGELIDKNGNAFMRSYHSMGSLAPRDIVARAIDSEMKKTGSECVYLDMQKKSTDFLKKRFPNIYERCLKYEIDLTKQPIPVVPAAHYTCGGVYSDEWGESSVENLFAVGEVACTGLHGANRLASNSLLEGVVFSHRAFLKIQEKISKNPKLLRTEIDHVPEPLPEWDSGQAVPMEEKINIQHNWKELRTLMWDYVGIVRTNRRLQKAQERLELIHHEIQEYYWHYLLTKDLIELRNLATVANLIIQSALLRKESRGLHYNLDHPAVDDIFFKRDTIL